MPSNTVIMRSRFDTGGIDAGIQQASAKFRGFTDQLKADARKVRDAKDQWETAELRAKQATNIDEWSKATDVADKKKADYMATQKIAAHNKEVCEKGKLDAAYFRQREMLEDRVFRSTHNQYEVQLRDLQEFYSKQKMMAQGNAAQLAAIDKSYAAESKALQQSSEAAGGSGGAHFGRHERKALKMIGGMALGEAGGEIGSALGMGLMMGGGMGIAIASIEIMAGAYKAAKEQAAQLVELQHKHAEFTRASAEWMRKLYEQPTTSSGKSYRERAEAIAKEAEKEALDAEKRQAGRSGWDKANSSIQSFVTGSDTEDEAAARKHETDSIEEKRKAAEQAKEWAVEEDKFHAESAAHELKAFTESLRVSEMTEGHAKKKAEIEKKANDAINKAEEAHAEAKRRFDKAEPVIEMRGDYKKRDQQVKEHEEWERAVAAEQAAYERQITVAAETAGSEFRREDKEETNRLLQQRQAAAELEVSHEREHQRLMIETMKDGVDKRAAVRELEIDLMKEGMYDKYSDEEIADAEDLKRKRFATEDAKEAADRDHQYQERKQASYERELTLQNRQQEQVIKLTKTGKDKIAALHENELQRMDDSMFSTHSMEEIEQAKNLKKAEWLADDSRQGEQIGSFVSADSRWQQMASASMGAQNEDVPAVVKAKIDELIGTLKELLPLRAA